MGKVSDFVHRNFSVGSFQTGAQFVEQPQQLCVLLLGQQAGDILVGLAEAEHDLLVGQGAGVGEDQALEAGVLGDAHAADIALLFHQLQDVGDGGAGEVDFFGGAPLGMFYKAANTMDSMVGYKNDKYLYFGRAAARLDDVLNLIPARVAGVLMCLGAAAGVEPEQTS